MLLRNFNEILLILKEVRIVKNENKFFSQIFQINFIVLSQFPSNK
jgi:hypothetical protein